MRIILCVTNDITTDQRIYRISSTLAGLPAEVSVVGVARPHSVPLAIPFASRRLTLLFQSGPLFYAEFNVRLFFTLLVMKADVVVANDLDTLPAVFCASWLRGRKVIYDSHEYFTELPELVGRKCIKKIWEGIESLFLPRVKHSYTVSASIADAYEKKYGVKMEVIRNLPFKMRSFPEGNPMKKASENWIIYQGSLNMGRGLEVAIASMQYLTGTRLIIAGSGYLEKHLKELVSQSGLQDKVVFTGNLRPEQLMQYTIQADLGISLEENMGLNYYYALPNKLFDYIQARIPVLVSNLPEMVNIVLKYNIGRVAEVENPKMLAGVMTEMLENFGLRMEWKKNLIRAAHELCWENEEQKLLEIYRDAIG